MTTEREEVEVEEADVERVAALVEGRTILAFYREPNTDEAWPQGANGVVLTFDDGSTLSFEGWGYDAFGLTTYYRGPMETPTQESAEEQKP